MLPKCEFVALSPEDRHQLLEISCKRFPKAAQFYNLVQISLSGSFNEENTFFRFNGLGEDSTSFVSKLVRPEKTFWYILAPICSGEESTKVLSAFNKIVNWDVDCSFLVIDDVIHNQFVTGCPKPEGLRPYGPGEVYYMPMEVAFGLGTSVPPGVQLRQLAVEDVGTVIENWKWGYQWGSDFITSATLNLGSAGLFLDGVLVSWGIYMRDGGIHAVFTVHEHRKKGYGKMLMRHLCKVIASKKHTPLLQIEQGNSVSVGLMTSIGFQFSHSFVWTEYEAQEGRDCK